MRSGVQSLDGARSQRAESTLVWICGTSGLKSFALALDGFLLVETEAADKGIEQFKIILQGDPDNGAALGNIGFAYLQTGDLDRAVTHYQEALRRAPDSALIHYNLGLALKQIWMARRSICAKPSD